MVRVHRDDHLEGLAVETTIINVGEKIDVVMVTEGNEMVEGDHGIVDPGAVTTAVATTTMMTVNKEDPVDAAVGETIEDRLPGTAESRGRSSNHCLSNRFEPREFGGDRNAYRPWREALHAYIMAHDPLMVKVLVWIEEFGRRPFGNWTSWILPRVTTLTRRT